MTTSVAQGGSNVEHQCRMAGVSRAGYYRYLLDAAPLQEEMGVRDAMQRVALAHRLLYGADAGREWPFGGHARGCAVAQAIRHHWRQHGSWPAVSGIDRRPLARRK